MTKFTGKRSDFPELDKNIGKILPLFKGYVEEGLITNDLKDDVWEWPTYVFKEKLSKSGNLILLPEIKDCAINYWFETKDRKIINDGIMLQPSLSFSGMYKSECKLIYKIKEGKDRDWPEKFLSIIFPFQFFAGRGCPSTNYLHEIHLNPNTNCLFITYCKSYIKEDGVAFPIILRIVPLTEWQIRIVLDNDCSWQAIEESQEYESMLFSISSEEHG